MFGLFFADAPVTSWDGRRSSPTPSASRRSTARCSTAASTSRRRSSRPGSSRPRTATPRSTRRSRPRATRSPRSGLTSTLRAVKVLLVTMYFPPAGGGGVQRSLKLAQYLPALGIETHVLAPDDPKWVHRDPELRVPTQAWVHRVRYVGPRARKPAEELAATDGPRARARPGAGHRPPPARPRRERDLEPHRDPGRDPHRAARGDRRRDHDLAARLGALRRRCRAEGDRCALARRPARPARREPAPPLRHDRGPGAAGGERAARAARRAARRTPSRCVSEAIADEVRGLGAAGRRPHDRERLRLRRLRRARVPARRRGSGSRTRGASSASATRGRSCRRSHDSGLDAVARFVGDFRSSDREWAESLGLGDRLELVDYAPRARVAAAPARLRGAAPARPGRRRPRQGRPLGEGLRVPRRRPADPRRRAAGRRRGRARSARRARASSSLPTTSTASAPRSSSCTRGSSTAVCPRSSSPEDVRATALAPRAGRGDGRAAPGDLGVTSHALPLRAVGARPRARPARPRRALPRDDPHRHVPQAPVGARRRAHALRRAHVGLPRPLRAGIRFEQDDARLTRTAAVALAFFVAFALVYLAGFYNLDTGQALAQWAKGMVKFVLHFGFLVAGVALLARRWHAVLLVRARRVPRPGSR